VQPRRSVSHEAESVTDDRLIEELSALSRLIDPVPWGVRAEAHAMFKRAIPVGKGKCDEDLSKLWT
jgi:hypothetical protein